MKPSNLFTTDDRAVSPVIGVILMVAITVILAAVIGTFVLGLGDSLGDSQPTAQLSAEVTNSGSNITVEHSGGDSIESGALNVIVSSPDYSSSSEGTIDQRFSVGDSVTASTNGSDTVAANSEELRIRVIHQPSESILLDRTFQPADDVVIGDPITFN
ncbi:type IV pilin [Halorubrum halodurans]|uniref:Archaeal Type IV pilin N-terminal domain-containing protein n=1 Tax=Halorubrum halodurans TaxID=1383851 RepID=A0A256IGR7_9EURY|nr:type IV pilin N-terminal domain-containing protein [Halorubrum halodurans]OYR55663.1 hypothetical protein DJ70_11175 [Halorubrum halodurans]